MDNSGAETNEDPQNQSLGRRRFINLVLKTLGLSTLGGTAAGMILASLENKQDTENEKVSLADQMSKSLQATATLVAKKGAETSFVPEKDFSPELFEKVRRGTFMLIVCF